MSLASMGTWTCKHIITHTHTLENKPVLQMKHLAQWNKPEVLLGQLLSRKSAGQHSGTMSQRNKRAVDVAQ